jgi:hypothetical protein
MNLNDILRPASRHLAVAFVLCMLVSARAAAQGADGSVRLVNVMGASTGACIEIDGVDRCAGPDSATAHVTGVATGEMVAAFSIAGGPTPVETNATLGVAGDSLTSLVVMGPFTGAGPRVLQLFTPVDTVLPESVSMLRIVHAAHASDIGRLDVVFRSFDGSRIRRDTLAYARVNDYLPVPPGPINVFGYYSDRADTRLILDELGAIPPGVYATALITGTMADGSIGVHLLIDSDTSAQALVRFTDQSTLGAPFADAPRVSLAPSPATDRARISLTLEQGDHVRAEVIDLMGRIMATCEESMSAGDRMMTIDVATLSAGAYVVRLSGTRGTYGCLPLLVQ